MANNDVVNKCIAAQPTKWGGIVVGQRIFGRADKKLETYDFKTGDMIPNMSPSGIYQTGTINDSGVAVRLSSRFDKPTYYSN